MVSIISKQVPYIDEPDSRPVGNTHQEASVQMHNFGAR